jgi:polyisoprenoid-binding protein YceI
MKIFMRLFAPVSAVLALLTALSGAVPENTSSIVKITSGVATFDSTTNMPGIGVKGRSNSISGEVSIVRNANGLLLQSINATVPVKTLATGMKVRDEHMRKMIFETAAGDEPDLRFIAESGSCAQRGSDREFACSLSGILQIRGIAKPVDVSLRVKEQSASSDNFKVDGDGSLKLSDYGITPPTQFGVSLANEVKFHLELTGKGSGAQ